MELGTWISSSAKCSPELARTPWPSGLVRSQPDPAGQGDPCALGGFCQLRPIPQRVLNERRRRLGPQWAHCCPLCWVSSEGGRYTQDSLQGEARPSKPPQQNKTVFPKSRNSQISTVPLSPLRVVFRFLSSPCAGSGREQPAGVSVQRPAGGDMQAEESGSRLKHLEWGGGLWTPGQSNLKHGLICGLSLPEHCTETARGQGSSVHGPVISPIWSLSRRHSE